MRKAIFVKEIVVTDPDSKGQVEMEVYKHEGGGMFAIDSSFLDEEGCIIPDPFYSKPDASLQRDDDDTEGLVELIMN